jgi:HPt (histidine-containing phosphotransfer) domain-containing protein
MAVAEYITDPVRAGRPRAAVMADAAAPLDLAHLRRFTVGNKALEREVLELFSEQAPKTWEAMQLARSEKAWREAAHTLKGSAFAVGANEIARTAAEAELARGEPHRWPELLSRLDAAIRQAQAFIAIAA